MTLRVHPDDIVAARPAGTLAVHPSWKRVRLASIATVLNGFPFSSARFGSHGVMPLLRIRDVGRLATDTRYSGDFDPTYVVEPGSLVVGMDGDFRVDRWSGPPALLNQRVCKITVRDRDHYGDRFLRWVLPAYLEAVHQHTSSVTVKHLSSETLKDLPLPLPPRAEQERIVAAIEEQFSRLDAGMEALKSARRKLKRMRIAVLQAAVTGRLVDQDESDGTADDLVAQAFAARDSTADRAGRGRSMPLDYLHDHVPAIPDSWRWVSLDAVADVVGGITKDAKKQTAPSLVEVPYLRVANVQRGYLDLRRVTTIKATLEQVAALRLEAGDVLFNEGGDRDKLGRGWVWEGQIDPCIHQNHVFRARLFAPVLDPRLLSWHGNTFGQLWFDRGGRQTTNLASVSRTTLRSFPVPIPPLAEQRRIVAAAESYLSLIDAAEVMVQAAEPRASALRTSILASAFTGKLVSQDPDDEPASVLLDRIAADRVGSNGRMKVGARKPRTPRQKVTA